MQLSTISPAPRACASRTQSRVERPLARMRRASPVYWYTMKACTSAAWGGRSGGALAVDADDHALRAEAPGELVDEVRVLERRGVDRDLVGARFENRLRVGHRADAAGDAERDIEERRHAVDPGTIHRAPTGAGGDVVEDELVRALVTVARGELQDGADDLMVGEAHTLHHRAVSHVEAGDDASGQNARSSSDWIRSSRSALPHTAAATPVRSRSARSAAPLTPPEACHSRCGKRARAAR